MCEKPLVRVSAELVVCSVNIVPLNVKGHRGKVDEELLTADNIKLAREYGRYGYRRIAVMLKNAVCQVNAKRVELIWRREGLRVPMKQPKRSRLWFNDGSCVRLRALRPNHVWSYDFRA